MADNTSNSTLITVQNEVGGLEVIDTAWDPLTKAWYDRMSAAESRPTFTQTAALDAIVKSLKQFSSSSEAVTLDLLDQQLAVHQVIESALTDAQRDATDPRLTPLATQIVSGAALNQYSYQVIDGYSQLDFTPYKLEIWGRIQKARDGVGADVNYLAHLQYNQGWKDLMESDCIFQFSAPDGRRLAYVAGSYRDTTGHVVGGSFDDVAAFITAFVTGRPRDGQVMKSLHYVSTSASGAGRTQPDALDLIAVINNNVTGQFKTALLGVALENRSSKPLRVAYDTRRNQRNPSAVNPEGPVLTLPAGDKIVLALEHDSISSLRVSAPEGADAAGTLRVEVEALTIYDMAPYNIQSNL